MNRTLSYFQDGKLEEILIILQQLSIEDGFTALATKSYITTRLTEYYSKESK